MTEKETEKKGRVEHPAVRFENTTMLVPPARVEGTGAASSLRDKQEIVPSHNFIYPKIKLWQGTHDCLF
jgi:hypothetical protein